MEDRTRRALWLAMTGVLLAFSGCGEDASVESGDRHVRIRAIRDLSQEGDRKAARQLAEATRHEDTTTALAAVAGLGRMPNEEARKALREAVAGDERSKVRESAIVALAGEREHDPDPASTELLRRVARSDPDGSVRAAAASALSAMGTLEEVRFLVEMALAEDDARAQLRAVRAIEDLLDLRFKFDPNGTEAERRAALERIRSQAPAIAEKYRRFHPNRRKRS